MAKYTQLITPNLRQQSDAGWCLFFVRSSYGVPEYAATATEAANKTRVRHTTQKMPNAQVPVWFWHRGNYGSGVREYGHVVIYVPGRGFLSSPVSGFGQMWLSSISSVERTFNSTFRFWSEDIGGQRVIAPIAGKPKKGLKVFHYNRQDKDSRAGGRSIPPGGGIYLNTKSGTASNAINIVGGDGPYSITTHLYAQGEPGDTLQVTLMWVDKSGKRSNHYSQQVTFNSEGLIRDNSEFKRGVPRGSKVYARVSAPSTNKKVSKVTLLDTDAYLIK